MNKIAIIFTVIGITFLISLILSLPVMLLWDWLMPILFGLPTITWLQAWGLTMLCNLLFKSTIETSSKK